MQIQYTAKQSALQPRLAEANINPDSFLATDYLNHFNEIVMLLEMVPDMPELLEDAADWHPKTYIQHFEDSGFQGKALAIEAYQMAPKAIRAPFDKICRDLDKLIISTLKGLGAVNIAERGMSPEAQMLIRGRVEQIQAMLMDLNKVIHAQLDRAVAIIEPEQVEDSAQTQEDIDKLFD
ncbi:hypothetical protein [Kordiimonas marina]|uniref:hypothetical protein n=1 Tax=Kordiimonas marina TaxID=2872312 RepID=UPI001FF3311E|nr:hypothetical protein [Kordiimonas marina]MCJ9430428.1 hypothetical protein [Kordiimonas marina]